MKKLFFAAALFMFICGTSTLVMAQEPEKPATEECTEAKEAAEEAPAEAAEEAPAEETAE